MENSITIRCENCGGASSVCVPEDGVETDRISCPACGRRVATVGQLHAQVAQEALGLGATDLRDDHVPVDGEMGERPGI